MLDVISKVNRDLLLREVKGIPLARQLLFTAKIADNELLASFLISYYGFELLRFRSIRHIVLTTLSLEQLDRITKTLKLPARKHVYDAALTISGEPWTKSSKLPRLLNKALEELFGTEIPIEYLPSYLVLRQPTSEEIIAENLPPLFDFQLDLSSRIYTLFRKEGSRGMLQMPTGSGKTRTVMHSLVHWISTNNDIGYKLIIWLAHAEELCEQAIDTFKRSWLEYGNGVSRLYRLFGSHKLDARELNAGIIFASLQKLYSMLKKSDEIYLTISSQCAALIFDEAHKALAPTYHELIEDILRRGEGTRLLGLSATPGRSAIVTSENKKLAKLFGGNLLRFDFEGKETISYLKHTGVLAKLKREEIRGLKDFELTIREKQHVRRFMDLPPSALKKIGSDMNRNITIVKKIIEQVQIGNQCIVFACSVEHAKILSSMICLEGVKACAISSEMRKVTRAKLINGFRSGQFSVVVNFGILTTGFDAPNIGAVFITRPTGSIILYSQMIGRGLRGPKVGGKDTCILVDVIDNIKGFGMEEDVYNHFQGYWN